MHLHPPTPRRIAASAALILALGACDAPIAPDAAPPPSSSAQAALIPNHVRYSGSGARFATATVGGTSVTALAALVPGDATYLLVTTGNIDDLESTAPGRLLRVRVRAFAPNGSALFTRTFDNPSSGGTALIDIGTLMRGATVQVETTVRRPDGQTRVVTVTETVKLYPRVQVEVEAPPRAVVGEPVVVAGVLSETNGDLGIYGTCELWVGGQRVDVAGAVWVAAGDMVSCAFTHAFTRTGTQSVTVTVSAGAGELSLPFYAMATGSVRTHNLTAAQFDASVEDRTVETSRVLEYEWRMPNGTRKEYRDSTTDGQRSQTLMVSGALPRATVLPLEQVELSMTSMGITYHDDRWLALALASDGAGRMCANRQPANQGAMLHLCTSGSGASGRTTFGYTRFAGMVTYHSEGFSRTWDGLTGGQTQNYTWNDGYGANPTGGQIKALGSDVTVRLRFFDASGAFGATPVIPLAPFDRVTGTTPRACTREFPYWLEGNPLDTCTSGSVRERGVRGSVSR